MKRRDYHGENNPFYKHGECRNYKASPLCRILKNIKQRTSNPNNKDYQHYGGRGISICEEWKNDSSLFFNWAYSNGYKEGLEIDRINNNGNYGPSNCRFTTHQINVLNKRKMRYDWGIYKRINRPFYEIQITSYGIVHYIGTSLDIESAIKKRDIYISQLIKRTK